MLANVKRRYMLGTFTVERMPAGWKFCKQGHEKEVGAWSKPYSSIASVTLMVARQLKKEIERRDAPFNVDA
jgi:hypothetical protein